MSDHNPLATVAHGHTLAEAIVDTVREPLVVLDRDLRVIAASRSFYRTFAVEPRNTQGRKLYELGDGQWNIPALRTVLEDIIPKHRTVEAYEVEHEFPTIGRRVMLLNARQVFDEDGEGSALLLAIEDVTERRDTEREKDELLRQKEVLLQEMQHRVANSLQIIASILLLKARTVQSEETRLHLHDAHQRVMSVATVQQQLRASGLNEQIEIGLYLSKLCDSLAASMVGERRSLSVRVQATSGTATSSEAVSLGLIVTELVINALKHAFPGGEAGEILVSYEARGSGWRLSVSDNGSGPGEASAERPYAGLGTSIVEALARQLDATVQKSVAHRGRPSQLLQAQDREGAVDKGSGPLDQRSTKQLKSDLARSELAPRKKSFVQEILRRRREAKAGDRSRKYVWLGAIITVFGLVGAALRQSVNRAK